ncbi:capsular polysaccharide biosynthesis protein [Virgibacillus natechei]|uniref:Capsular polysaccharide biosynthesis protein n=1 Tax=Virgibacillus natechei TaxID=1216297 RepID=A0ABS4IEC2_9BACI|nr:Wzz/FepE/Etk N-terminal domain-containing protein [Virgibacillus natechei]MBP1969203.1 capsular polysaccharide biosynthesis protein [Virgibacillus natechei]UZD12367.1 Wzz/FepE/Etk N-terminal domain-containing protein [Virgibacillus natechei]
MEETISLKEIYDVIKKRLMLIIAFVLGAALIAAVVSYFVLTPTYESSSQFIVSEGQQDPAMEYNVNDNLSNTEIIDTYNVIINSPAILDEVIAELGSSLSVSQLGDKIQVASEENSQVVTVTATDEDPAEAVAIANTTVEVFENEIPEIMHVDNVSVLSEAELSESPSPVAPNPPLNIAIAIVLGGMVGVGLAFLLEYLDNTITTEDDIEKRLELPVLGVISHINDSEVRGDHFTFQADKSNRRDYDGAKKESV